MLTHALALRARSSSSSSKPRASTDQSSRSSIDKRGPPPSEKTRVWHDRSGQFRVEAAFLDFAIGKIRLHKVNGVVIEVPSEKMSVEDMRFVERVTGRMRKAHRVGRTVVLRVRFDDFARATRSHTLSHPTAETERILAVARGLLASLEPVVRRRGLTLVGVAVANLDDDAPLQLGIDVRRQHAAGIFLAQYLPEPLPVTAFQGKGAVDLGKKLIARQIALVECLNRLRQAGHGLSFNWRAHPAPMILMCMFGRTAS